MCIQRDIRKEWVTEKVRTMIQVDGSRQGTSGGSRTCSDSNKDNSAGVLFTGIVAAVMNLGRGETKGSRTVLYTI